jgi:hypothetical protein
MTETILHRFTPGLPPSLSTATIGPAKPQLARTASKALSQPLPPLTTATLTSLLYFTLQLLPYSGLASQENIDQHQFIAL